MKKMKSVKFYNFIALSGAHCITFNANFYDQYNKLIIMNFNDDKSTSIKTETDKYLISASSSYTYNESDYPVCAFHTSNVNNTLNINPLPYRSWVPSSMTGYNEFIKFEFKKPTIISNIKIIHSCASNSDGYIRGFLSCDVDIEYDDNTLITTNFTSNGKVNKYSTQDIISQNFNQEEFDAQFAFLDGYDKYVKNFTDEIGFVETDNNNCFRNINSNVKTLKCLYTKPTDTEIKFLISFDKKSTWKMYDGSNWNVINDTSESNILLNGSDIEMINNLDNVTLKAGGFIGDMDFKIALHTNDKFKTPAISKIYVEYK